MITETIFMENHVRRQSDRNVLIRKNGTDETYAVAEDLTNEWRTAHGLPTFEYEETEIIIEAQSAEE